MKRFKELMLEFESLRGDPFGPHSTLTKHAVLRSREFKHKGDYSYWNTKEATPSDLRKHESVPLDKDNSVHVIHHKDYDKHGFEKQHTVHVLHNKKHGFVGMINGLKTKDGFQIKESFLSTKMRGKGLGKKMYQHVLEHHGKIVSDTLLSSHSQNIYKSFAKKGQTYAKKEGEKREHPVKISKSGNLRSDKVNVHDREVRLVVRKKIKERAKK